MNYASTRRDRDFLMEADMRLDMFQGLIIRTVERKAGRKTKE
jgi:hypothetical protein